VRTPTIAAQPDDALADVQVEAGEQLDALAVTPVISRLARDAVTVAVKTVGIA